ncbi:hypothetical protein E2I00_002745 [Balaenoptera physalus]|uniref:EGF-like domain-containing protein n=1 Tax=Balaenoptera physalus TaxID=9770 RepID=A0A643BX73_BALPH|nr:hypothetical protein E2I00_002745 [Balaenoptera physalus]
MPQLWALALPLLLPWVAGGVGNAASPRGRGLSASSLQPGVCRYGTKLACCYGWRRSSKGVCEATCEPGCKFGECVGPNKCRCIPGYTGKTCSQDSRTCAMTNCQYGCKDTEEGPHCLCPSSGLRLAPNGRACIDTDECASDKAVCPHDRRCVNTFGSYYCKCHVGFELKYLSGRYDCVVIPENSVKEFLRAPGTIKDRIKKLLAHKNNMKKKVKMKNIAEPGGTPAPKVDSQPFNSEESVSRDGNPPGEKKRDEERKKEGLEEERRDEKALANHVEEQQSLRGDVFYLNISVDCSFDHGVCDWKQDIEDDFDWNPADRDNAVGYYMAVPVLAGQKKDIGRLKLVLPDLQPQSNFCLLFHYRLAGNKVGKLRVFVKNSNNALAWEKTRSTDERWKMGKIQLYQGIDTPKSIIFEAERGKGKTGEIAVDGVLLVSGLCPDGLLSVDG